MRVASECVGAAPGRAVAAVTEAEGGGGGGGGVGGFEGGEDGMEGGVVAVGGVGGVDGDFPRPFVQTPSFPRNSRLKRLPKPQKVERTGGGSRERAAPGGFHASRPGPRCAAPGASRARARPHMWGSQ